MAIIKIVLVFYKLPRIIPKLSKSFPATTKEKTMAESSTTNNKKSILPTLLSVIFFIMLSRHVGGVTYGVTEESYDSVTVVTDDCQTRKVVTVVKEEGCEPFNVTTAMCFGYCPSSVYMSQNGRKLIHKCKVQCSSCLVCM